MIDRIYELAQAGNSLADIARKLSTSHTRVRDAILADQPGWLDPIMEVLPPWDLRDLIEQRISIATIADIFNLTEWKVRVYVIVLPELVDVVIHHRQLETPQGLLDSIQGSEPAKGRIASGEQRVCERCTILEEPRNPVEGGVCLWCRVELAGWNILTWHEEGCPEI